MAQLLEPRQALQPEYHQSRQFSWHHANWPDRSSSVTQVGHCGFGGAGHFECRPLDVFSTSETGRWHDSAILWSLGWLRGQEYIVLKWSPKKNAPLEEWVRRTPIFWCLRRLCMFSLSNLQRQWFNGTNGTFLQHFCFLVVFNREKLQFCPWWASLCRESALFSATTGDRVVLGRPSKQNSCCMRSVKDLWSDWSMN